MIPRDELLRMYRTMVLIRRTDDRLEELLKAGQIKDHYPPSGHEAVAVGACGALHKEDLIISYYRGLGHLLTRGADPRRILAEYFGKTTGYCRGKGGAKHVAAFDLGIYGSYSIVGANIPIAAGVGLACKNRTTGQVVLCFFGDGASNQGTFHEGLNLAAILKVPVIFLCENNCYAQTTPVSYSVPIPDISARAASYNMPGVTVNGMDVLAVREAVESAAARARGGEGPSLVECKTYRYKGHFAAEFAIKAHYREEEEIAQWRKRDPIVLFAGKLKEQGVLTESMEVEIRGSIDKELDDAVEFARRSPLPAPEEALEHVFASPVKYL